MQHQNLFACDETDRGGAPAVSRSAWLNAASFGASGSSARVGGTVEDGGQCVVLDDVADFQAGQEVAISGCHLHYYGTIYNEREPFYAKNQRRLDGEIEIRGLAADKTWQTFLLHFDGGEPGSWKWMVIDPAHQTCTLHEPVIRRLWQWQEENLPVGADWVALCDGVEIRFRHTAWVRGQSLCFHARNRLLTRIAELRGRTVRLADPLNTAEGRVEVTHFAQSALQSALDAAVAQRKGLLIPEGRYRLSTGLWLRDASARIEGTHREHTILDVSEDHTAVFWAAGGRDVAIRNLCMTGHTGFLELPANTAFNTATGFPFWPTANQQMEVKGCAAVNAVGTEFLTFEDLLVRRMASEAFYLHGSDRYGTPSYIQGPHENHPGLDHQFTKSCIYHRCRVEDCGFNAFNNNDHAENTSILHCRVERATNFCENASRFTRVIGNYVKDGCSFSIHGGRATDPEKVGPTQAIITNNVFEGGTILGGLSIGHSADMVTVSNNLFLGFSKESAITVLGGRRVILSGNQIDLTRIEDNPDHERCGICIEAPNVLVADNHIFARGELSDKVTAIHLAEDASGVHIHDNLIENCGWGIRQGRRIYVPEREEGCFFVFRKTEGEVVEVKSPSEWVVAELPKRTGEGLSYQGWALAWLDDPGQRLEIESFDAATRLLRLKSDAASPPGRRFTIHPPDRHWSIHHNTLIGCG